MLRLAPVVAAGRAVFAAAAVLASAETHASIGHTHVDLPSVLLAFFCLLFVSWRSNNPRSLLMAAIAAQALVHFAGGHDVLGSSLTMITVHALGAVVAWMLLWRFEQLWAFATSAICAAINVFFGAPRPVTALAGLANVEARSRVELGLLRHIQVRRGPPVFA